MGHQIAEIGQRGESEIGVNGFRTITGKQGEMMHLARRACFYHQARACSQTGLHQMLMHGAGGQQGGDGDQVTADVPVRQDDDIHLGVAHDVFRIGAELGECRFRARSAPGGRIAHGKHGGAELAVGEFFGTAQLLHIPESEDRLADFQAHGGAGAVRIENVGPRADEGHQRHDQLLADRVYGRIGHLRKQLAEVGVERLGPVGQYGERRVVAHGTDGFLGGGSHGCHQELEVFLRVAEGLLAIQHLVRIRRRHMVGIGDIFQPQLGFFQPLLVGAEAGQLVFEFLVVDDAALLKIDEQHLAGLQAPFLDDLRLRHIEYAHFRSENDMVVVGDDVARGTQPVAIQRRANLLAVGEGNGRRTVPWLHESRVVFVESPPFLVHERIAGPGFGDHEHHCVGERVTTHHQQFEGIVERSRVRLAVVNERPDLVQVVAQ